MNQNTLNKAKAVQEITVREKRNGLSQKEIYWRFIRDTFFISLSTYQRYLCIDARHNESKNEEA